MLPSGTLIQVTTQAFGGTCGSYCGEFATILSKYADKNYDVRPRTRNEQLYLVFLWRSQTTLYLMKSEFEIHYEPMETNYVK